MREIMASDWIAAAGRQRLDGSGWTVAAGQHRLDGSDWTVAETHLVVAKAFLF